MRSYDRRVSTWERIAPLTERVSATGLLPRGSDGVVMLSGGADSTLTAAVAVALCGPEAVAAVHVNYGLREDSDRDESAARELCARLRIDLHIERPRLEGGNLQATARAARYAAAERLRDRLGAVWVATGHTRSDIVETMLYRLATSPGSRALIGLAPRNGRVVRPIHFLAREEVRTLAAEAGLPYVDDPSNSDLRFARNRIRHEILPALDAIGPEVERTLAATHAELSEEAGLLERIAVRALADAGADGGRIEAADLDAMDPALRRIALRILAEREAGRPVAVNRARATEIARLAAAPEGGEVDLGGGLRAICESYGVRFARGEEPTPAGVRIGVPGEARFGEWEVRIEIREGPVDRAGVELATVDATALGSEVEVRGWRSGDRMEPLGLGGSKSLQDLFVDRGVPRSIRPRLPVVVAGGEVAWVAGVAVSERFRLGPGSQGTAVLTARPLGPGADGAPPAAA
jgi:tRNA(Ile)-lysidine synthase